MTGIITGLIKGAPPTDPDPGHIAIPHSLHKYLYGGADGVNRIDPTGRADLVETTVNLAKNAVPAPAELVPIARDVICFLNTATDVYAAYESAVALRDAINARSVASELTNGVTMAASIASIAGDIETCTAQAQVKTEVCPLCFAAGTPVHTDHGDVPIENLHEGDKVEARDNTTGKLEERPVTALTPTHKDSLLEIRVEGERSPLRPSTHHPFWARRGDQPAHWIDSGDLRVGDRLLTMEGSWRAITSITPVEQQETVYNFTVAKDHDYFVGQTGFLVHNKGCGCRPTYLYAMNGPDGRFLKWGISYNPARRYSKRFLNSFGGSLEVLMSGSRQDMLDMERTLTERYPGPLNKEPWAGCNIP